MIIHILLDMPRDLENRRMEKFFFRVGACLVCHNATICDKLPYTELQIREGIEDNLQIIFLIVTPH